MIAVFLTHADAKSVGQNQFRALSEQGRAQVNQAVNRFLAIARRLVPDLISKQFLVGEIISSPLARCVETTLLFSDGIREFTASSEIRVCDALKENQLSAKNLKKVLDDTKSQAVVICTHGDLACVLPGNAASLRPESIDNKGWFVPRPVLVVVEYERKSNWDDATVLCCESPPQFNWETLLMRDTRLT